MATDDTRVATDDAYEIIKAKPTLSDTLEVDGQRLDFRTDPLAGAGMMRVKDRGLAMAIRDKYGRGRAPDVTVTRVKYPHLADRGHRYFFGQMPEMPWKRKEDNGKESQATQAAETGEANRANPGQHQSGQVADAERAGADDQPLQQKGRAEEAPAQWTAGSAAAAIRR